MDDKRITAANGGLIFIGIALILGSPMLDGFVSGLLLGAGLAIVLIGVYILSARRRAGRHEGQGGAWLPSRDHDR